MNWVTVVDSRAEKDLRKFPINDQKRIKEAIDEMEFNPFSGDVVKLEGYENNWRRRVGNYRIFFEIYRYKNIIYIAKIKRRTSSTY